jgi:hypothetical protein
MELKGQNPAAGPNQFSRKTREFHRLNPLLVIESKV